MRRQLVTLSVIAVVGAGALAWRVRTADETRATPAGSLGANASAGNEPARSASAGAADPRPAATTGSTTEDSRPAASPTGTPPESVASDVREIESRRAWNSIAQSVRRLDNTDQAGLDELYARARTWIQADERAAGRVLAGVIPELVAASYEESFFAASAWIRSSARPTEILDALFKHAPAAEPAQGDAHRALPTQQDRLERVEAYSLRELVARIGREGAGVVGLTERGPFVADLAARAIRERSLDLSIELCRALKALGAETELKSALAGHSARDQGLIQAALR